MPSHPGVLIRDVLYIKATSITPLTTKMQITDEREADFIFEITEENGKVYLLHIEFQVTNDPNMPYRMLRYWVFITETYKKPVKQCLFYVGKELLKMSNKISATEISYEYEIIDFRDIDCNTFLNSNNPKAIVISILCDYKGRDVTIFIREILERIRSTVKEETLRSKYIRQLEVLSRLRGIEDKFCEEVDNMAIVLDIEGDYRFRQGREKGLKEGIAQGLIEGIELALDIRFGNISLAVRDKIRTINDINKLEQIKDSIKKAGNLEEFKTIAGIAE